MVDDERYLMLESVAEREAGKSSQKDFKKRAEAHLLKCFERLLLGQGHTPLEAQPWGLVHCVYLQTWLCLCCTDRHAYRVHINRHMTDLSAKSYKSAIPPLTPETKGKGKCRNQT